MIARGAATVDDEIVQQIVDTAGSNFVRLKDLARSLDPRTQIENLVQHQTLVLRELFEEKNEAYQLLLKIYKEEKVYNDRENKLHSLLLSSDSAICGVHPNGYLIFSMPVIKKALQIIEQEKAIAIEQKKAKNARWTIWK